MKKPPHRNDGGKRPEFARKPSAPAGAGSGVQPPQRKRTAAISIGAIGVTAVALVAISNWQSCRQPDPNNPNAPPGDCRSSGSSNSRSSSGHVSSSSSSSSSQQQQPTHTVQRSGFGKTGLSFFSGGS